MSQIQTIALPQTKGAHKLLIDGLKVIGASFLIALFAPIAIRLPFSPVPIALQLHVILFLSVMLGSKRSTAAVFAYLAYGACGLPVFAGGGFGLISLFGPTGGYLFGYLLAAYLTGFLCERMSTPTLLKTIGAVVCGNILVYLTGAIWLGAFVGGWSQAVLLGVLPFLPGDALKTVLLLKAVPKG